MYYTFTTLFQGIAFSWALNDEILQSTTHTVMIAAPEIEEGDILKVDITLQNQNLVEFSHIVTSEDLNGTNPV